MTGMDQASLLHKRNRLKAVGSGAIAVAALISVFTSGGPGIFTSVCILVTATCIALSAKPQP